MLAYLSYTQYAAAGSPWPSRGRQQDGPQTISDQSLTMASSFSTAVMQVQPVEPCWVPERHNNKSCISKLGDAAIQFKKRMRHASMVMVASNLWDIVRLQCKIKSPDGDFKLTFLPSAEITEWQGRLAELLAAVESTFPGASWMFKTTPYPNPEWPVCSRHAVHALNVAGAAVAFQRGWRLADAAALTASFSSASDYLQDMQHPQAYISLTLAQMILHDVCSTLL